MNKLYLSFVADAVMKFLERFDKDRTIGSITKKEIKDMLKEEMEKQKKGIKNE